MDQLTVTFLILPYRSPARIKINIRDLWTKPDSKVQKSIGELKALIGREVLIEPEWQLLWAALQAHFPDPGMINPRHHSDSKNM
jgi:hypothetical protein